MTDKLEQDAREWLEGATFLDKVSLYVDSVLLSQKVIELEADLADFVRLTTKLVNEYGYIGNPMPEVWDELEELLAQPD